MTIKNDLCIYTLDGKYSFANSFFWLVYAFKVGVYKLLSMTFKEEERFNVSR